ncbi:hydroxyphenylacetyl-CoA thioesterase PaaI [Sphingomonas paucimobilis]|uniref:hydroxyphenylacetyl-CoA thioesterase PaaI n=1 Tax=Sphingomonas paucimobilis TaxID=13689 RepID=UPI000DE2CB41|nr:hydroxyphenylacetyl-CoA thioesterase PaaI [Sphingomonas paucimobilis]QBE92476.1 hydroxyphenylacetyl-CoA thioesterase PaaI [Sphingomonas paucimobilis]
MSDTQARAIANLLKTRETMGAEWEIAIEEVRLGYARIAVTVSGTMLNGYDMAHGGAIFTLADQAFAYACNSHNDLTVAQSATISFLSPARRGERIVAEAQEVMKSGRSGAYAITVRTDDGRDIAAFHGLSRTIGGAILDPETNHA